MFIQVFLAILAAWAVIQCLPLIAIFLWWFIKYGIAILFFLLFFFSPDFRVLLHDMTDIPIVQVIGLGVMLGVFCCLSFPVITFQVRLAQKLGWKKYLYKIFRIRKNKVKDDLQAIFVIGLVVFLHIILFISFLVSIEKVL